MREELTRFGFEELLTSDAVDEALGEGRESALVVVNSVCGCSAAMARPAVAQALQHTRLPRRLYTVFAGMEVDAVDRARSYFTGYAPSSPCIALFDDGKLVYILERRDIEGRTASDIAVDLVGAFDRYLGPAAE